MFGILYNNPGQASDLVIIYAKSTTLDLVCVRGSTFMADGGKNSL